MGSPELQTDVLGTMNQREVLDPLTLTPASLPAEGRGDLNSLSRRPWGS
jgi:hypothetical protein